MIDPTSLSATQHLPEIDLSQREPVGLGTPPDWTAIATLWAALQAQSVEDAAAGPGQSNTPSYLGEPWTVYPGSGFLR